MKFVILTLFSFSLLGQKNALDNFVQLSKKTPNTIQVIMIGTSWCNPCNEFEKLTLTNKIKNYPKLEASKKLYYKIDLDPLTWEGFKLTQGITEIEGYPTFLIYKNGKIVGRKTTSAPWEVEKLLEVI